VSWFSKKKEDPDAELKEVINEVAAKITKETLSNEKKYYKVSLHIYLIDGLSVDYWYSSIPEDEVKGKNARQWFKPFFKWFFHTKEEYYYQTSTDGGGLGIRRSQIKFFKTDISEQPSTKL
jgi:hypothetical protein